MKLYVFLICLLLCNTISGQRITSNQHSEIIKLYCCFCNPGMRCHLTDKRFEPLYRLFHNAHSTIIPKKNRYKFIIEGIEIAEKQANDTLLFFCIYSRQIF